MTPPRLWAVTPPSGDLAASIVDAWSPWHAAIGEPEALLDFAPGVVPCTGAFQMAVTLWRLGCVGRGAIGRVASAMLRRKIAPDLLAHRLGDLVRRAVIDRDDGERIAGELVQGGLIEPIAAWPEVDPVWERQQARVNRVWTPARYLGE